MSPQVVRLVQNPDTKVGSVRRRPYMVLKQKPGSREFEAQGSRRNLRGLSEVLNSEFVEVVRSSFFDHTDYLLRLKDYLSNMEIDYTLI